MNTGWRAARPQPGEFAQFYAAYIALVPDGDVVEQLARQIHDTSTFLHSIPESSGDHRYAEGKWSVREVIGHMGDAERVFAYRALRFSRGDRLPVEGFDENLYVQAAPFARRTLDDLTGEFEQLRGATIAMLGSLDEEAMTNRGVANGNEISVRALAFIMAGHELHHLEILRTRYLA